MKEHMAAVHPVPESMVQCHLCPRQVSAPLLNQHIKQYHFGSKECTVCGKKVSSFKKKEFND